jgi:hypothetical protein
MLFKQSRGDRIRIAAMLSDRFLQRLDPLRSTLREK